MIYILYCKHHCLLIWNRVNITIFRLFPCKVSKLHKKTAINRNSNWQWIVTRKAKTKIGVSQKGDKFLLKWWHASTVIIISNRCHWSEAVFGGKKIFCHRFEISQSSTGHWYNQSSSIIYHWPCKLLKFFLVFK